MGFTSPSTFRSTSYFFCSFLKQIEYGFWSSREMSISIWFIWEYFQFERCHVSAFAESKPSHQPGFVVHRRQHPLQPFRQRKYQWILSCRVSGMGHWPLVGNCAMDVSCWGWIESSNVGWRWWLTATLQYHGSRGIPSRGPPPPHSQWGQPEALPHANLCTQWSRCQESVLVLPQVSFVISAS